MFVKCTEGGGGGLDRTSVRKAFDSSFALVRLFTVDPKEEARRKRVTRVGTESIGDGVGEPRHVGEKYAEHCIRKSVGGVGGESENRAGHGGTSAGAGAKETAANGAGWREVEDKREKEIGAEWAGGNRKEEERGKKGFEDSRDEESSGWVVE